MQVFRAWVPFPRRNGKEKPIIGILQAREVAAVSRSEARDKRDIEALSWTLQSLTNSTEIEPFVEGIAGFLGDLGSTNHMLIQHLLEDPNTRLGTHVVRLLSQAGYQEGPVKVRRTVACLSAMWSLLQNCSTTNVEEWFDEETLPVLEMLKYDGPLIGQHLSSTLTIYLMRHLDSFSDFASHTERALGILGLEGPWVSAEPWVEEIQTRQYLNNDPPQVSTGCMVSLKEWKERIQRSIPQNNLGSCSKRSAPTNHTLLTSVHVDMDDLGSSLKSFQAALFETRLTLFNDYVAEITSDHPPFEAWDTFYDITIDPTPVLGHGASLYNQRRLVGSLESALLLPRLAVDHLLNLVNILEEPELLEQADSLISEYAAVFPDSAAALEALDVLQRSWQASADRQ